MAIDIGTTARYEATQIPEGVEICGVCDEVFETHPFLNEKRKLCTDCLAGELAEIIAELQDDYEKLVELDPCFNCRCGRCVYEATSSCVRCNNAGGLADVITGLHQQLKAVRS